MYVRIAQLLVALTIALAAAGQAPGGAGIVYGTGHAFAIQAPPGWVLDNTSGKKQGLHAVFYEEGKTWQNAKTVMYANAATRHDGEPTVEGLIAYDIEQFKKRAPRLDVTPAPDIRAKEAVATVRQFQGDQYGNFEAVAYIEERGAIIMLVLSARTKEQFERNYPAFEKLVGSYRFLTSDVQIQK